MKGLKLRHKFQLAVLAGLTALSVLIKYAPLDVYAVKLSWDDTKERQELYLKNESNRDYYQAWLSSLDDAKTLSLLDKTNRVNDLVNNTVTYMSDSVNYGRKSYFASGVETVCTGRGDCEDFAIAKLYALQYLGVPENRMCALTVATNPASKETNHAIMVVDTSAANTWDGCLVLDDAEGVTNSLRTLGQTGYKPFVAFNFDGVRRWNAKTPKSPST
ncbi:MAG: transglutaminase-like cysteine peptidase [Alphaproteobacteria bacterium]|nr:transglutaminase-like cysteine peptidase [Alphaproteobacteria bacterium]